LQAGDDGKLDDGQDVGVRGVDADVGGHVAGGAGVVTGEQDRGEPEGLSRATAWAEVGLIVSATAIMPRAWWSQPMRTTVWIFWRRGRRWW
jgi:hypothetical protein